MQTHNPTIIIDGELSRHHFNQDNYDIIQEGEKWVLVPKKVQGTGLPYQDWSSTMNTVPDVKTKVTSKK